MNRLMQKYQETVKPNLIKEYGYTSSMQAPKLEKIVINFGVGDAIAEPKALEEAVEELEIDFNGDGFEIGFNVTYLLDVLTNLKNDNMQVDLMDGNSSVLMTIPDNSSFKYVVMPMRI